MHRHWFLDIFNLGGKQRNAIECQCMLATTPHRSLAFMAQRPRKIQGLSINPSIHCHCGVRHESVGPLSMPHYRFSPRPDLNEQPHLKHFHPCRKILENFYGTSRKAVIPWQKWYICRGRQKFFKSRLPLERNAHSFSRKHPLPATVKHGPCSAFPPIKRISSPSWAVDTVKLRKVSAQHVVTGNP